MNIRFSSSTDEATILKIEPSLTVKEIKQILANSKNLNPKDFFLVESSRILNDNSTFQQLLINEGRTVFYYFKDDPILLKNLEKENSFSLSSKDNKNKLSKDFYDSSSSKDFDCSSNETHHQFRLTPLLRQFYRHPQINKLRRIIKEHPESLLEILELIQRKNTLLLKEIAKNQSAFISILVDAKIDDVPLMEGEANTKSDPLLMQAVEESYEDTIKPRFLTPPLQPSSKSIKNHNEDESTAKKESTFECSVPENNSNTQFSQKHIRSLSPLPSPLFITPTSSISPSSPVLAGESSPRLTDLSPSRSSSPSPSLAPKALTPSVLHAPFACKPQTAPNSSAISHHSLSPSLTTSASAPYSTNPTSSLSSSPSSSTSSSSSSSSSFSSSSSSSSSSFHSYSSISSVSSKSVSPPLCKKSPSPSLSTSTTPTPQHPLPFWKRLPFFSTKKHEILHDSHVADFALCLPVTSGKSSRPPPNQLPWKKTDRLLPFSSGDESFILSSRGIIPQGRSKRAARGRSATQREQEANSFGEAANEQSVAEERRRMRMRPQTHLIVTSVDEEESIQRMHREALKEMESVRDATAQVREEPTEAENPKGMAVMRIIHEQLGISLTDAEDSQETTEDKEEEKQRIQEINATEWDQWQKMKERREGMDNRITLNCKDDRRIEQNSSRSYMSNQRINADSGAVI